VAGGKVQDEAELLDAVESLLSPHTDLLDNPDHHAGILFSTPVDPDDVAAGKRLHSLPRWHARRSPHGRPPGFSGIVPCADRQFAIR